jgi:small subunit ribosomal protein S10
MLSTTRRKKTKRQARKIGFVSGSRPTTPFFSTRAAERIVETASAPSQGIRPILPPTKKEVVTILRAVTSIRQRELSLSADSQETYRHRETPPETIEALMSLELPAGVEIEIKL